MHELLATQWLGRSFTYFDELDSTNTYCKDNADTLPHGAAVIAGRQTRGKGRLGKTWEDPGKVSLILSFLLHGQTPENLSVLPLLAGMSVCAALEKHGIHPAIKWSNDILLENKKICGILCESRIIGERAFAVVGIGVNMLQTQADFDRHNLVYATSLHLATAKKVDIFELAAEILNEFEPILQDYSKNGFIHVRERYKSNCITLGREVRILTGEGEAHGLALDIGDDGSLICNIGGKVQVVRAGEASVRGIFGYV